MFPKINILIEIGLVGGSTAPFKLKLLVQCTPSMHFCIAL